MMALMFGKLYVALKSANVPDDTAREAAEEVAAYDTAIAEIKSQLRLHGWSLSFNTAGILAI